MEISFKLHLNMSLKYLMFVFYEKVFSVPYALNNHRRKVHMKKPIEMSSFFSRTFLSQP